MKLIKTKPFEPYTGNRCTLTDTGAGVYIIAKEGKPLYIGFSAKDVKKTMYRHFQEWNDPTQARVTYKNLRGITCRVIWTKTPTQAADLETALILRLKPRDNQQKLEMYAQKTKEIEQDFKEAEIINADEPCPF
jgi:excinuclease UvrABC nuclease subunit